MIIEDKVFIDLETSGLQPGPGVIFSIGVSLSTGSEIETVIKCTEEEFEKASPQALKVNGITWEYLERVGVPLGEATERTLGWLVEKGVNKDWAWFGQNVKFDKNFMSHFMGEYFEFYGLPDEWLDMIPLYKHFGRQLGLDVNYQNTHHISQQLEVPEEPEVHRALEGARAVKRNYVALRSLAEKNGLEWKDRLH